METYRLTFNPDYTEIEEWVKKDLLWKKHLEGNKKKVELCKKWKGKEITISELENLMNDFGLVVFNGKEIDIFWFYQL